MKYTSLMLASSLAVAMVASRRNLKFFNVPHDLTGGGDKEVRRMTLTTPSTIFKLAFSGGSMRMNVMDPKNDSPYGYMWATWSMDFEDRTTDLGFDVQISADISSRLKTLDRSSGWYQMLLNTAIQGDHWLANQFKNHVHTDVLKDIGPQPTGVFSSLRQRMERPLLVQDVAMAYLPETMRASFKDKKQS